jgi:hypothetical protein
MSLLDGSTSEEAFRYPVYDHNEFSEYRHQAYFMFQNESPNFVTTLIANG